MVEETDFSEDSMDEDIQESYYYYTVIEKIEQQHQENKRKGELFLKGRGLSELSKAEFEELQKMTNNFYLDPFAPDGKQIIINRQIFREREEYLKIHNERSEIDSDIDAWYGLNLYSILRDVDYIGSIAKAYNSNSFYFRIVSDLAFIHYMRKLHFPIHTARAIADPDEPTMSEQSMNERGVIIFGGYACDLNLGVTLDKREYDDIHLRGAFSLFFALRLSQIDIMHIMSFLDYQLDKTFKGDLVTFKMFLKPLLIGYKTITFDAFDVVNRDIISAETADFVKDWISTKITDVNLSRNVEEKTSEFGAAEKLKNISLEPTNDATTLKKSSDIRIHGKLNTEQIKSFLGLLGELKNRKGQPILDAKSIEILQKQGLTIPADEIQSKILLNINNHEKRVIYVYFHAFWEIHTDSLNDGRLLFAQYISANFTNFSNVKLTTLQDSIRKHRVAEDINRLIKERVKLILNSF